MTLIVMLLMLLLVKLQTCVAKDVTSRRVYKRQVAT